MKKLLFLIAFICIPVTATAQDFDQFEQFRDEALAHYAAKNYPKAIASFRKAHAIIPNAVLLYNVASAHAKLGNYAEAITASEQAKQHQGMDPQTALNNESRIHAFEVKIQADEAAEAIAENLAAIAEAKRKSDIADVVNEPAESSFGALGWTGVALTTLGAAAVGYGVVLSLDVDDTIPIYEEAARTGNESEYNRLKTEIGDKQTFGQVALYGGLGLAVVGATLIVLDLTNDGTESPDTTTWFVAPSKDALAIGFVSEF